MKQTARKINGWLNIMGLSWLTYFVNILVGEDVQHNIKLAARYIGLPIITFIVFLVTWHFTSAQIQTSLGRIPGPIQVNEAWKGIKEDTRKEKENEKLFYERLEKRNKQILAANPNATIKKRMYSGKVTFNDQIITSLKTVFTGFLLATVIAIPIGIFCGLSNSFNAAVSPLIQIFKPVSPLAWLPIVTMTISAIFVGSSGGISKSFLNSAITVSLCCLWPTLINTATGVSSIDKDLTNVGRVLNLGAIGSIFKIVLPSALPLMFTGLRLSLGVGWMVLIAAEMLAQNPGLGKFVWDEFQNGSSQSLARIILAVFVIGIIGAILDRLMYALQNLVSFGQEQSV